MTASATDLNAERAVLGALQVSEPALGTVLEEVGLLASDFYFDKHRETFAAAAELHRAGKSCDELTLAAALEASGDLEAAGGRAYLSEMAASVVAPGNVRHHAGIVFDLSLRRAARLVAADLEADRVTAAEAAQLLGELEGRRQSSNGTRSSRLERGGGYVLDAPERQEAVWGAGDRVLWPKGEPLMLAAPQGVGKTTVAQQLALARCGVRGADLLGLPVARDTRPVLYIAADRPEQARRSFARMVGEESRADLDMGLLIWRGPPPVDVLKDPSSLARWVSSIGAGTVFVDSLKDLAVGLAEDAVGSAVNQAIQEVVADGVEFASCHHQRKSQDGRKPRSLDDVYGSTWLTAGAGSVILLWGKPGDSHVQLTHLKQPEAEVGPLEIQHDHLHGVTTVPAPVDLIDLARHGVEVKEAARRLYATDSPDRNQIESARRKLERLAADGHVERHDPGNKNPVTYTACDDRRVIPRDTPRDESRTASRPSTAKPDSASQSITAPITVHHADSEKPADPLKGAVASDRDEPRDPQVGRIAQAFDAEEVAT